MTADAEGTATREAPFHFHGVTLDGYAGVVAGLAEGLSVADVLRNERVDPAMWPDAEEAFQDLIADDDEGLVQARFDELLAAAQTRYARAVKPLDDDVGVWLDFARLFAAAEEPLAFLASLGLLSTDLLRLHRLWAERIADDPQVADAARAALERAPRALPPLLLGDRVLRPPPEDRAALDRAPVDPKAAMPRAEDDEDDEDDDEEAAAPPEGSEPPFFAPLPNAGTEPSARAPMPTAPPPALIPPVHPFPARAPRADATGAFVLPTPEPPAPPPAKADEREAGISPWATRAAPPPPPAVIAGTGDLPADLVKRIHEGGLPFARSSGTAAPPPPDDEPATLEAQPSPLARAVLPFTTGSFAAAPSSPASPQAPPKAPVAAAPPEASPGEATLAATPSPLRAVLPFQPAPTRRAQAETPPAAAHRPAAPPVAPPPPMPTLTLEQYASMCAELAVFHDRPQAVFAKYGLGDAGQRAAVDAAWKARLARYPSEKAEWERRYWQYEASWRRSRR